MALKDWTKDFNKKNTFQYRNKKNKDIITSIRLTGKEPTNTWKGWIVDVKFGKKLRKTFKTKSQAFAYARNYMRTH